MNKIKFTSLSLLLAGALTMTSCGGGGVQGAATDAQLRDFPMGLRMYWDKMDKGLL